MKNKWLALLLFFVSNNIFAFDVNISWDFNPVEEKVEYYTIYQAKNNSKYSPVAIVSFTENNYLIRNLTPGTYRFIIIANNAIGKSNPSQEAIITGK